MVIILESPNKCSKIANITGAKVFATKGHFKELIKEKWLDLETYEATFDFKSEECKKTISNLVNQCRNQEVHISTDPDREGYAIGYFFYQLIKNVANTVYRTEFHEITETGIKNGFLNKKLFENTNKLEFDSFRARSVSDKLVGYILSPELSKLMNIKNLSVGRVQTPALALLVKRELEIEEFKKLLDKDKVEFAIQAILDSNLTLENDMRFKTKEEAEKFISNLNENIAKCIKIENKELKKTTKAPFQTSTFLKEASNLGFSSKQAMDIAQELFEAGLITYHRTDAEFLSEEFLNDINQKLKNKEWYQRTQYKSKNSQANAHEAIRFTHYCLPEEITDVIKKEGLEENHQKIYELIYKRTIISQSKPILIDNTTYIFNIKNIDFKASINNVVYNSIYDEIFFNKKEIKIIPKPDINENQDYNINKLQVKTINKNPPSRYNEGDFIPLLQKEGIGRPSTYANFIPVLLKRGYIEIKEENKKYKIYATNLGIKAIEELKKDYEWITTSKFTSDLEEKLDLILNNKSNYKEVIKLLHEKMQFKDYKSSNYPPTPKQIELMKKIATMHNLVIPQEAFTDYKICSNFIESAPKLKPSQKQINLAKKLANENNVELPINIENDINICKNFINKYINKTKNTNIYQRF